MSQIVPGAFVVHAKLSELGSAEVLSDEKGTLRLRFACGERSFLTEFTSQHLSVVVAGPAPRPPAKSGKRARVSRAKPRVLKS
jgi:hypothetical protein